MRLGWRRARRCSICAVAPGWSRRPLQAVGRCRRAWIFHRRCSRRRAGPTRRSSGGNLGTAEAVLPLLRNAGFAVCRAASVHREWLVDDPRDIVAALARGTVRTAALIAAQPAQMRPAIEAAVAEAAAPYRSGGGFAVPIVAILAYGVKPGA